MNIKTNTIARVFPRKTNQSPTDDLTFFDVPGLFPPQVDEVHISVAFTYDIPRAEMLAKNWAGVAPIKMGGPAFGQPSGEFEPGKYVKQGITITSRGCPNKCWFCSVWKREPKLKLLEIKPGYIIQDDNFLACSEKHVRAVFEMLKTQEKRPMFLGGLEAKLLKDWHINLLKEAKTQYAYFAYDTHNDYEPLLYAGKMLQRQGFNLKSRACRCFVLCGFPGDNMFVAETRMHATIRAGFWPLAMLWKDDKGNENRDWRRFSRYWARPAIYYREVKSEL